MSRKFSSDMRRLECQGEGEIAERMRKLWKEHAALLKFARQQNKFRSTPTLLIPYGAEAKAWEELNRKVKL